MALAESALRYMQPDRASARPLATHGDWIAQADVDEVQSRQTLSGHLVRRLRLPASKHDRPWQASLYRQLSLLLELLPNWDDKGGQSVSDEASVQAEWFMQYRMPTDAAAPTLVPTNGGGIQLEWHQNGVDLEVRFEPRSSATVCIFDQDTDLDWAGHLTSARALIKQVAPKLVD